MKVVYYDLQQTYSPDNGCTVQNRDELLALLDSVRTREAFGCELLGTNNYKLTLGIGKIGFVQYSRTDGMTPYLLAVGSPGSTEHEYVEFLVGDTLTSVSKRFCLPFESVREIAAYFVETGERSPAVTWEEV